MLRCVVRYEDETMKQKTQKESQNISSKRKSDHIQLAFDSQIKQPDSRFYYEPMLSSHPRELGFTTIIGGREMSNPLWVSSMTGGTEKAKKINTNLARACREFGLGMGLGSCRSLLYSDERMSDFDIRAEIGQQPLFANLGIAQVESLVVEKSLGLIDKLIDKLQADGLIIHVNPTQEWLQPEGDKIYHPPIDTIRSVLEQAKYPIIVKEVGQGMGPESLALLLSLPLEAVEFASLGGTNFAMLELLRADDEKMDNFKDLIYIGHTAEEMVQMCNEIVEEDKNVRCKQIIISGGIRSFLDGYYLINKAKINAVYGQAAPFLKHAQKDYPSLQKFVQNQIDGLKYANAFLRLK